MLILLSPSKSITNSSLRNLETATQPAFLKQSAQICDILKKYSAPKVAEVLKTSPQLTRIAMDHYQHWNTIHTNENALQAVFAFNGEVYSGLEANQLSLDALHFAQDHLIIFSAFYGALLPLDLIQPYRLDVGNTFKMQGKSLNLYWKKKVTRLINENIQKNHHQEIINLASLEYFSLINQSQIKKPIITPVFKEFSNGKYKIVIVFAKKARGRMTKYLLTNKLNNPEEITLYNEDGYIFDPRQSNNSQYVFVRG